MSTKIFDSFKYYCDSFDDLIAFIESQSTNFLEEAIATNYFNCLIESQRNFNASLIFHNLAKTDLVSPDYIAKEKDNSHTIFPQIPHSLSLTNFASDLESKKDIFLNLVLMPKKFKDEFGTYYLLSIQHNEKSYNNTFSESYPYINKETTKKNFKNNTLFSYYYFNNTDQPKDISNKEWEKRDKDWDVVFEKNFSISFAGFTKKMISSKETDHYYFKHNVEKNTILQTKISHNFSKLNLTEIKEKQLKQISFELFFNGYLFHNKPSKSSDVLNTLRKIEDHTLEPIEQQKYLDIYNFCHNNYLSFNSEDEMKITFAECLKKIIIQDSYLSLHQSFEKQKTITIKKNKI